MESQHPQIGTWYEDRAFQTIFEVVAIDDHAKTIELQYANGDIDEMEFEQWVDQLFQVAAAPTASDDLFNEPEDGEFDAPANAFPFRQPERFITGRKHDADER